MMKESLVISC